MTPKNNLSSPTPSANNNTNGYGSIADHHAEEEAKYQSSPAQSSHFRLHVSSSPLASSSWSPRKRPLHSQHNNKEDRLPVTSSASARAAVDSSSSTTRNRILLWLVLLVCAIMAFGIMLTTTRNTELSSWQNNDNTNIADSDTNTDNDNDNDTGYWDYIVVGGGPSGIIAATQLARNLTTARILLVESGTVSQSSVLESLEEHKQPRSTGHSSQSSSSVVQPKDTTTATTTATATITRNVEVDPFTSNSQMNSPQDHTVTTPTTTTPEFSLNKYDIPLLWSGIASNQRRVEETFGIVPNPHTSAFWPIPLALLVRGLGGCGLHNAMIYVRSLPSCFERWNLTSWTFDDMLPIYKRLETFVPRHSHSSGSNSSAWSSYPKDDKDHQSYQVWLDKYRGTKGPIRSIQAAPEIDSMGNYFVEASLASGIPLSGGSTTTTTTTTSQGPGKRGGFNHVKASDRVGVGFYEFNIHNGVRHSVVNAMLGGYSQKNRRPLMYVDDKNDNNNNHHSDKTSQGQKAGNDERNNIPLNLEVQTGRTVTHILWSNPSSETGKPTAVGITYLDNLNGKHGKALLRTARNAKGQQQPSLLAPPQLSEVILATGAIMTPQILWNSGIGDGGSLVHLPGVGKNLQDHPVLGMAFEITKDTTESAPEMFAVADEMEDYVIAVQVLNDLEEKEKQHPINHPDIRDDLLQQKREWAESQLGTFGTAGFSAGGFLRSPWADDNEAPPDIQLTVFPRVIEPHQPKSRSKVDVQFMRSRAMLVTVALLQPEARYEVKPSGVINSNNTDGTSIGYGKSNTKSKSKYNRSETAPYSTADTNGDRIASHFAETLKYPLPSIQLPPGKTKYLSETDVKQLAWGMQQVRRILQFPPMANITIREIYPGPSVVEGEALNKYIRANHLANSHWVGTTKMGRDDDPLAVLDEKLRVRGVEGLRVFDSGAIPFVPNGNIHSTVCAVASRGVDLILADRETRIRQGVL